jgi:hypothetical protein
MVKGRAGVWPFSAVCLVSLGAALIPVLKGDQRSVGCPRIGDHLPHRSYRHLQESSRRYKRSARERGRRSHTSDYVESRPGGPLAQKP